MKARVRIQACILVGTLFTLRRLSSGLVAVRFLTGRVASPDLWRVMCELIHVTCGFEDVCLNSD
jgi:hypothetical protein